MNEEKIAQFLVGEMKTVNLRFPKKTLDIIISAMKKKEPTRKDYGMINHAINYFAVRGFLDYEDEHREDAQRKKDGSRS